MVQSKASETIDRIVAQVRKPHSDIWEIELDDRSARQRDAPA